MPGWWDDDDDDYPGEWMPELVKNYFESVTWYCACRHYKIYGRCQHMVLYRRIVVLDVMEKYL